MVAHNRTNLAQRPELAAQAIADHRMVLDRAVLAVGKTAVFEEEEALDRFEGFASEHGAGFYGLPLNEGTVTLERVEQIVPDGAGNLVPFHSGETLSWRIAGG